MDVNSFLYTNNFAFPPLSPLPVSVSQCSVTFLKLKGREGVEEREREGQYQTSVVACHRKSSVVRLGKTVHTAYCAVNSAHCKLQTVHFTLHPAHCTLHIAHCTLHTAHCILHTDHFTLHTARCTPRTEHSTWITTC